jgi:hypothetical protein
MADPNNPNPGQNPGSSMPRSGQSAAELKDLQNAFKQLIRDGADFNDIIKDQVNELKKLQTGYNKVRDSIDGFRSNSLDVKKIQSDINDQLSKQFINAAKLRETQRQLSLLEGNQYRDAITFESRLSQSKKRRYQAEQGLLDLNKEAELASEKLFDTQSISNETLRAQEASIAAAQLNEIRERQSQLRSVIDLEDRNYETIKNALTPLQAEFIARTKSKEVLSLTVKDLEAQLAKETQIQKSIGITGKLAENFSKKLGLGTEVYEAMVRRSRELQLQNTKEFKEELARKNDRISAINEVRKAQGKNPIPLIEVPKGGVFKAGFSAFRKSFSDSWKNDPLFKAALFLGAAKALNSALQGTIKMFKDGMVGGMKAVGGELAEGPIQNLTKPISGLLEKIPLVGGLLSGLVDVMSTFFDFAVNANSQFVKMGRELGLGVEESIKLEKQFSDFANSTNDVFINSKKMYEAQIGLSKALGTTSLLSNEILATNIRLKDVLGLEEEAQVKIAEASTITGKESQNIVGNIIAQVANLKKAGLATQDWKAVVKEVTNLGGVLGLTFAKYPEKITKAVLQTKAMGLELKQLDGMADSFLDFESSISKEMEAQLLTGKDINLAKAREAFLNNDLAAAAEEITKQTGGAGEFLKMNRIQQQSLAEAMGMTRDSMADMLKKQEFLKNIGATDKMNATQQYELAKKKYATLQDITNEQEKQQYQALATGSAQEKIAAFLDKIKAGFVDIIANSGVTQLVDKAITWLSEPDSITGIVNSVKNFFAQVLEVAGSMVNAFSKIANIFLIGDSEIREDYGDQLKDFGSTIRSSNLGQLSKPKAADGGVVQESGNAVIDKGEFYFGKNSAQYVKEMGENTKRTNELLEQMNRRGGTNDKIQIAAAPIFLGDTKVGALILNSFENNQYSKFDRGNLFT